MSQQVRAGFRVPPIHKPPSVEAILGQVVELLRVQGIQIDALKAAVGQDAYDAALRSIAKPDSTPAP